MSSQGCQNGSAHSLSNVNNLGHKSVENLLSNFKILFLSIGPLILLRLGFPLSPQVRSKAWLGCAKMAWVYRFCCLHHSPNPWALLSILVTLVSSSPEYSLETAHSGYEHFLVYRGFLSFLVCPKSCAESIEMAVCMWCICFYLLNLIYCRWFVNHVDGKLCVWFHLNYIR